MGHVEVESFIKRHNFVIISTLINDKDGYFAILIWLYSKNPIMKEYVKVLATLSISTLIWGKKKYISLELALFKSLTSTHTLTFPPFFEVAIIFDTD